MNGFGFIEYEDAMDARDVVPGKSDLPGQTKHCAISTNFPHLAFRTLRLPLMESC